MITKECREETKSQKHIEALPRVYRQAQTCHKRERQGRFRSNGYGLVHGAYTRQCPDGCFMELRKPWNAGQAGPSRHGLLDGGIVNHDSNL